MSLLSPSTLATLKLRGFGLAKIFLLFLVSPKVKSLDDSQCQIEIPLNRITRNHVGSMYFGTLCMGADCAGGLLAVYHIKKRKQKIGFIFKALDAKFLKRPERNVVFTCKDGAQVAALVEEVMRTRSRSHIPLQITATVPTPMGTETVAEFTLTLSLKPS